MASDHDDPEVVIKAEKSSDELREERRQAAERDGDVLDVSSDSDEAAPPMKRVKTEPKAEKVALSTHGSFDPPHARARGNGQGRQGASGGLRRVRGQGVRVGDDEK